MLKLYLKYTFKTLLILERSIDHKLLCRLIQCNRQCVLFLKNSKPN